MNYSSDFLESIQYELYYEPIFWNPSLLLQSDCWKTQFAIGEGKTLTVQLIGFSEYYDIQTYPHSYEYVDIDPENINSLISQTIQEVIPVNSVYDPPSETESLQMSVKNEKLTNYTDQLKVHLPWDNEYIIVNVPLVIEDKQKYAKQVFSAYSSTDQCKFSESSLKDQIISKVTIEELD